VVAVNVAQALKIPIVLNFAMLIDSSKLNLCSLLRSSNWLLQVGGIVSRNVSGRQIEGNATR
jgi:hypothetical protein